MKEKNKKSGFIEILVLIGIIIGLILLIKTVSAIIDELASA